ncbi:MAG TPA: hypothetical protein VLL52_03200 [Anaerolineae bacterium]|nr:hypothetical protein [Anaerolineae bacterium]
MGDNTNGFNEIELPGSGDELTLRQQIELHLEFLGYEIRHEEKMSRAIHPRRWNLGVRDYKGGILFSSFLRSNDWAKSNQGDYVQFINGVNQKVALARFYVDDDGDFVMEAWWVGGYDRTTFGRFMEQWQEDTWGPLHTEEAAQFFQ